MKKVPVKKWLIPAICAVIAVAAVVAIVLLLQPKGGVAIVKKWKPKRASSNVEPYARRAIEIIDSYLAFEIDGAEVKRAVDEVRTRMEELDISYDDKRYTLADDVVDHRIFCLYIDADKMTDSEFWEYRDVLAFQIGEDVSGRVYPAKQDYFDDDDRQCLSYLDEYANMVDRYSCYVGEDWVNPSVEVDRMNGVGVGDIYSLIKHVWRELGNQENCARYTFKLSYKVYGQEAFSVVCTKYQNEKLFLIFPGIDSHAEEREDISEDWVKHNVYQTEYLQELKEELDRMAKAFDP